LKIINGQEATPHSWPSMAYISFEYKFDVFINNFKYTDVIQSFCGGTLISTNEILTSAR
jgi:hypothetical protein